MQDIALALIGQLPQVMQPEVPPDFAERYTQLVLQYSSHSEVAVLQHLWRTLATLAEPGMMSHVGPPAVATITDETKVGPGLCDCVIVSEERVRMHVYVHAHVRACVCVRVYACACCDAHECKRAHA